MPADRSYEERSRAEEGQQSSQTAGHERYEEEPEETVQEGRRCPSCGFRCDAGADLCEACGQWLLEGQCRYCYQFFKPGQRFCTQCGNPPEGIVCKQCHVKTHFDVCPTCHLPLSRRAGPAQEAMREQERAILSAVQEMLSVGTDEEEALGREYAALKNSDSGAAASRQAELDRRKEEASRLKRALGQLEDYYDKEVPAGPGGGVVEPAFRSGPGQRDFSAELRKGQESEQAWADKARAEAQRAADDQARIEGVVRRIQQVKKDKENALIAEKIRKLQDRTFPDAQSARLYSMQVQEVLEHLGHCEAWIGWKCNRYGCVHFNGPVGCSSPESGGRWVCDSEVSASDGSGTFVLEGIAHVPRVDNPQASCPG